MTEQPQSPDPAKRSGSPILDGFAVIGGILVASLSIAVASFFVGLAALSVRQPVLSTITVVGLYGAALWGSFVAIRKTLPPFVMGLVIGCMIGCLLGGICSTIAAIGSAEGLNFH